MVTYENIGELNRRLLGYSQQSLRYLSGLSQDRLAALQCGEPPTIYEAEVLGRLFGIEPDILEQLPIEIAEDDAVRVLALLEEFSDISGELKARIIEVSNAAKDLVELRLQEGEPDPWSAFTSEVREFGKPKASSLPHEEGRHYAGQVRTRYKLGTKPIHSVRDWISSTFPQISVLYANLGDKIAGVTFADKRRGATIVINLDGKNQNPCVRRFSLLHELCHILIDSDRHQPLAQLSGFLNEVGLDRERRANAFAMRLLCPEQEARRAGKSAGATREGVAAAKALIDQFGIHYSAARLYLRNLALGDLPPTPPAPLMALATDPKWEDAEAPVGIKNFPLYEVPPERRTSVARYASRLYARGEIPRDYFARLLGVTPASEVERVLAYFELDPPSDSC